MGGGGGQQSSTTVQSTEPPAYLQPYLKFGASEAQRIYQSSQPQYMPGDTVAAQSPLTQEALSGIQARAINGSPVNAAAGDYLQRVLGDQYLNAGNPYQGALDQSITNAVLPSVNSQFAQGGRFGSGAYADSMTKALADAIAPSHYQNYQAERSNQQQAAGMAPAIAGQDWADLGALQQAGQQQDQYGQALTNANVAQWNYNQNLQGNKLAQMMALLSGGSFGTQGTSTTTSSGGSSPMLGLLGGLLSAGVGLL